MAKFTPKPTVQQPDPFQSLPAPSPSHCLIIANLVTQLHEAVISAYMPTEGELSTADKRAAAVKLIQENGRPTFTDTLTNSTDTCLVARKVYDKCGPTLDAAADQVDKDVIKGASEPYQVPARNLRKRLEGMSPAEAEGIILSDTVSVPLSVVEKCAPFNTLSPTDLLLRLAKGRAKDGDKVGIRGLGYEIFQKGETWFVRVPFNAEEPKQETNTDTDAQEAEAVAA